MDLNEDLIALVGPNEAGKSSIRGALDLVGRLEIPQTSDSTRGLPGPATLSALFVPDTDQLTRLEQIHLGEKVSHVRIT